MDCRDKPGNDRGEGLVQCLSIVIPDGRKAEPGSGSPGARWYFPSLDQWLSDPGYSLSRIPG